MPTRVMIYITWPVQAWCIPDRHVAALRQQFANIDIVHVRTPEDAAAAIVDADVAFAPFLTPAMVDAAPKLRWVHSPAAAVEGLLPLAMLEARGIAISNSRGVQAIAIAEHVMGGLLVLSRKFHRMLEAQRERRWIQNDLVHDWPWTLHGKRMTIVGLGSIGQEVAARACAFGMHVTGVRRSADRPLPNGVHRVVTPDHLYDALRDCDVLVLSAPAVDATKGMIGAAELALLNPGAVLVNVARAQIVDEPALIQALSSGQLGGAVLDVFPREPLPAESPFWDMENVVVTPHSSGFRSDHWDDVTRLFAKNLERFRQGQELVNLVDPRAGY